MKSLYRKTNLALIFAGVDTIIYFQNCLGFHAAAAVKLAVTQELELPTEAFLRTEYCVGSARVYLLFTPVPLGSLEVTRVYLCLFLWFVIVKE